MYAASPGPVDGGFLVGVQIVRLRYTNLRYDECGSVLLQRSSVPVVRRCHTASRLRMVDSWSGKYHSLTHTLSPPERCPNGKYTSYTAARCSLPQYSLPSRCVCLSLAFLLVHHHHQRYMTWLGRIILYLTDRVFGAVIVMAHVPTHSISSRTNSNDGSTWKGNTTSPHWATL